MWRDLLRRLEISLRYRNTAPVTPEEPDVWDSVGRIAQPASEVLAQIEQTALDIYATHGLPTRTGHYRRSRRARAWTFMAEHMTPEERWAALQERSPEAGWRYGALADIGRNGPPEVRAAAGLLAGCAYQRALLAGRTLGNAIDDIERAIRLGADWHALEMGRARHAGVKLRLTAPDDARPVAMKPASSGRKKGSKPRL